MLTRLLLAACCLGAVGCEPIGHSLVSPSSVSVSAVPASEASTICDAIRSGRVKPLVHVPECD